MFNFLLQGKVGEMMAPVQSQEAQLLIAIQNSQPDKVRWEGRLERGCGGNTAVFLLHHTEQTFTHHSPLMPQRKLCSCIHAMCLGMFVCG